jgi:hypothetical protein
LRRQAAPANDAEERSAQLGLLSLTAAIAWSSSVSGSMEAILNIGILLVKFRATHDSFVLTLMKAKKERLSHPIKPQVTSTATPPPNGWVNSPSIRDRRLNANAVPNSQGISSVIKRAPSYSRTLRNDDCIGQRSHEIRRIVVLRWPDAVRQKSPGTYIRRPFLCQEGTPDLAIGRQLLRL